MPYVYCMKFSFKQLVTNMFYKNYSICSSLQNLKIMNHLRIKWQSHLYTSEINV